ncbi:MAG: hypothetical protein A2Y17_01265 [Clostridiales bacterium GWF2_38_85]|nr:MAG: hypothetical protein A2Y17_01265 [Clostridiales bacterium GWF2_38_85]
MKLNSVSFYNFRNNDNTILPFSEDVNVIYGKNAAGKTNILEAVFFFAAGKSFRSCKERDMIRFTEQEARVDVTFSNKDGAQSLSVKLSKKEKKEMFRNNIQISRLSEYLGRFRAVVFTPDHLCLVKGSPERRRKFVDIAISQTTPKYVALLNEYNRVLLQKNSYLKCEEFKKDTLIEVYNERLAHIGAQISIRRYHYLTHMNKSAADIYSNMTSGRESLGIRYVSSVCSSIDSEEAAKQAYMTLYQSKLTLEKRYGMTVVGAHKDDFDISINNKDARLFCSQGQQRSAVLSLKLSEGELSKQFTGEYPVFLLDDILSELDSERKGFILHNLLGKQVIITSCEDILEFNGRKILVENGKYKIN